MWNIWNTTENLKRVNGFPFTLKKLSFDRLKILLPWARSPFIEIMCITDIQTEYKLCGLATYQLWIFSIETKLAGVQIKILSLLPSKKKKKYFLLLIKTVVHLLTVCIVSAKLYYHFSLNFSKVRRLTIFETNLFMTNILISYTSCYKIVAAFVNNWKHFMSTISI